MMNNCADCGQEKEEKKCVCERAFLPEDMSVTMAYVPFQLDLSHFTPDEALCKGTLFTELDKPFKGRCVR